MNIIERFLQFLFRYSYFDYDGRRLSNKCETELPGNNSFIKKPKHGIDKKIIEKFEEHYMEKEEPKKYYKCKDNEVRELLETYTRPSGIYETKADTIGKFTNGYECDMYYCTKVIIESEKKYYLCPDNISRIFKYQEHRDELDYDRHSTVLVFEDNKEFKRHSCTEITEDQYNENKKLKIVKINEDDMWYVEEYETHWKLFLRNFLEHDEVLCPIRQKLITKTEVHPYQIACCSKNSYYPDENMTKFILEALNKK